MPLSKAKFSRGMTPQQYMDQIKVNKQPFLDIYRSIEIPAEHLAFFNNLAQPLRLAVFNAEWCGDALSTTPVLLRLAQSTDKLPVRVFDRDKEIKLTDSFLPDYRAGTVPVFVVFDEAMGEVARFIETAKSLVPAIDAMDEMIAREAAASAGDDARAVVRGKRTAFRVAHAREWGRVILGEFRQVLAQGLALPPNERPAVGGTEWPPPD
jgi:thiol-disulfide isomerase/thioredoxin